MHLSNDLHEEPRSLERLVRKSLTNVRYLMICVVRVHAGMLTLYYQFGIMGSRNRPHSMRTTRGTKVLTISPQGHWSHVYDSGSPNPKCRFPCHYLFRISCRTTLQGHAGREPRLTEIIRIKIRTSPESSGTLGKVCLFLKHHLTAHYGRGIPKHWQLLFLCDGDAW